MSVVAAELIAYAAASRPLDDASLTGGAIDLTTRVILTQIAATDTIQILSDGADVRTVTVIGRTAAGVETTEAQVLNGVTAVTFATSFERILSVVLSAASAVRTVTVRRTTGATTIVTIGGPAPADPSEIAAVALFRRSTIPVAGTTDRYEKFFWKNSNAAAFALTTAVVSQAADPQARITHALAVSVDEANTIANRITAPGAGILAAGAAGTFDDTAKSVPAGSIAAGSRIGVWLKESLPSTDTAFKSTYTSQLDGNTT